MRPSRLYEVSKANKAHTDVFFFFIFLFLSPKGLLHNYIQKHSVLSSLTEHCSSDDSVTSSVPPGHHGMAQTAGQQHLTVFPISAHQHKQLSITREKAKHCTSIHSIVSSILQIMTEKQNPPTSPVFKFTMETQLCSFMYETWDDDFRFFIVQRQMLNFAKSLNLMSCSVG